MYALILQLYMLTQKWVAGQSLSAGSAVIVSPCRWRTYASLFTSYSIAPGWHGLISCYTDFVVVVQYISVGFHKTTYGWAF